MSNSLTIFLTALCSSLIMVPFVLRWAAERGALDLPDPRKIHVTAVPRIGGLAIFLAILFSLLVCAELEPRSRGLLAGGLVVFFTGFIDDLYGLSPRRKFIGEILGCLVTMVAGDLYLTDLGNLFGFGPLILPSWLAFPFTLFAIVGVINAVNLIDGLDGLAGGLSVIAGGAFFLLAWHTGNTQAMVLCAALLGAILGFLKYNYYPARIFMGDAGSLVVGFMLGFVAVILTQGRGATVSPVLPLMILGVPIVDTVWVMTKRLAFGKSPFAPDNTHVHHKFLDLGLEHRFTVIVIYGISLFWVLCALLLHHVAEYALFYTFFGGFSVCYLALRYVLRHPQKFPWLQQDSMRSLRQSNLYVRLAAAADRLVPALMVLYLSYLSLGIFGAPAKNQSWVLSGMVLVLTGGLLLWRRNAGFSLVLVLVYIGNLVLAFEIEKYYIPLTLAWGPLFKFSDWLFLGMGALFVGKVLFRRDGEFFLGGVELLSLGLSVFTAVVVTNLSPNSELLLVLFKGVVLTMALKVLLGFRKDYRRIAMAATMVTLLAVTLRGYFLH